jgi:hypothetical protein
MFNRRDGVGKCQHRRQPAGVVVAALPSAGPARASTAAGRAQQAVPDLRTGEGLA